MARKHQSDYVNLLECSLAIGRVSLESKFYFMMKEEKKIPETLCVWSETDSAGRSKIIY